MDTSNLLSRDEAERIIRRVLGFVRKGDGETAVYIQSWWNGELRWARNRVSLASDRRDLRVNVTRITNGADGSAATNQTDDVSLEAVVRVAERSALVTNQRPVDGMIVRPPELRTPEPAIWSDATFGVTAQQRGQIAQRLAEGAESATLSSAGYLEMRASVTALLDPSSATPDRVRYIPYTQAQCSMTVRHPKGVGSGWAGLSSYDWSAIDGDALARRALDKCRASLNPVAIEPGRYTVVLEPQAVSDFIEIVIDWLNERTAAEMGMGPFPLEYDNSLRLWRTKLGLKVFDERITISHDPADPLLGVVPSPGMSPITWVDRGVLSSLSYGRAYALSMLNDNLGDDGRPAYRMSGGGVPIEEMIGSTKRGLLVTRFSGLANLHRESVLMTGVTRDGLWLIENGKISKAVKNLRFTESPMFMLNQIEQLGIPVPVFRPVTNPYSGMLTPAIVPVIKANDFSFTATIDAI